MQLNKIILQWCICKLRNLVRHICKRKEYGNWIPFVHRLLWSSGQSFRLQVQRSGFDSRLCQIFWEAVGPERSPLSLVSTTEQLLERKSCGSGIENREYDRRDLLLLPSCTLYPQKLALISRTSSGHSDGIVRSRSKATEVLLLLLLHLLLQKLRNSEQSV
jgi:hypothetical protein